MDIRNHVTGIISCTFANTSTASVELSTGQINHSENKVARCFSTRNILNGNAFKRKLDVTSKRINLKLSVHRKGCAAIYYVAACVNKGKGLCVHCCESNKKGSAKSKKFLHNLVLLYYINKV